MAEQSNRTRAAMNRPPDAQGFDAAWLRLRQELEYRVSQRFGLASNDQSSAGPDPELLADLALERALMP